MIRNSLPPLYSAARLNPSIHVQGTVHASQMFSTRGIERKNVPFPAHSDGTFAGGLVVQDSTRDKYKTEQDFLETLAAVPLPEDLKAALKADGSGRLVGWGRLGALFPAAWPPHAAAGRRSARCLAHHWARSKLFIGGQCSP